MSLAPVYVNDARVVLLGDPRPKVAKIVQAAGKRSQGMHVVRLRNQSDSQGLPLRLEDAIDRTQDDGPVYLKCFAGTLETGPTMEGSGKAPGKGQALPTKNQPAKLPAATAEEVNETSRETRRAENADREAQEDGTQRSPPT